MTRVITVWNAGSKERVWWDTVGVTHISAGPCLPGATRLRRMENQSLISYPNCFSIFHHQFINLCKFPLTNQQLIHQLVINLLFAGLQVSNLGLVTVLLYPLVHQFTTHHVHVLNLGRS